MPVHLRSRLVVLFGACLCAAVLIMSVWAVAAQTESLVDVTYTIQPGDTLDTIGQRFDVSVVVLQRVNDLAPGAILFSGQPLLIPAGSPPYGFFPALIPVDTSAAGGGAAGTLYVVQPRDVADLIAAYFDVDLACLAERNLLAAPARLTPGMELLIPTDCPPYSGMSMPGVVRGFIMPAQTIVPPAPTVVSGSTGSAGATVTPAPVIPTLALIVPTPEQIAPAEVTAAAEVTVEAVAATQQPRVRPPTVTPTPGA